jgi:pilus assembly protein Flp/PilA
MSLKGFSLSESIASLLQDEEGATAIEYALIASLVSVVAVSSAFLLGGGLTALWDNMRNEVVSGLSR